MRTLLIMLGAVLTLSGCKPIIKTVYGIKKPRLESDVSIRKYLAKKEMDTSRVVTFPTVLNFAVASEKKILSFPEAMFFNKEGFLVPYKPTAQSCNADVDKFIADLRNFSTHPADQKTNLRSVSQLLDKDLSAAPADITVLITWATYVGRLNKTKAFEWVQALEKAKKDGLNVSYYLLNCDFNEKWNLTAEQKQRFGLN